MRESFTLLALQRAVEALAGQRLHKQNFRRLIDQQGLVEDTGQMATQTGGRPAKLVRFRREVLLERAVAATKLPLSRPGGRRERLGAAAGWHSYTVPLTHLEVH